MEVDTASEDIRARQSAEGELCTVSTTTDGFYTRGHTAILHGTQHDIDDVHVGIDFLLHVIILVLHLSHNGIFAILLLHLSHTFLNKRLAVFEAVAVVVADDIAERGLFNTALDAQQVIEAFIAIGRFGCLVGGQHLCELYCQTIGIHHFSFGIAWVHADSLAVNLR